MIDSDNLLKQSTDLLKDAHIEIRNLRQANQIMGARLSMFDDMMSLLRAQPVGNAQGMTHPDVSYNIEKFLSQFKK